MGGKTSTSTQSVQIPPEVLARYNSVNAQAQQVASQPFQAYSNNPNAFVAPLTSTQRSGLANTNAAVGTALPFYQGATGMTLAGSGAATPMDFNSQNLSKYMSPYLGSVVQSTMNAQNQQNALQQSQLQGQQIMNKSFGGDRANISSAVLSGQQSLANAQTISNLLNQGYGQGLGAFQQQQGVDLSAQQANLARLQQGGQQLAGLGTGVQQSLLTGANQQMTAGTAEQQTNQAGLSALYNQYLQQQGYPFQVAQFLANIAEGTGALSGSTTTTTQPAPFFSDRRLKHDVRRIGETDDGQPIYKFKYKGDPKEQTHIGLMADEVEKHHPEAVGLAGGYKTVDYDAATRPGKDSGGGLDPRRQYPYGPFVGQGAGLGATGYVPPASMQVPQHLMIAGALPAQPKSTLGDLMDNARQVSSLAQSGKQGYDWLKQHNPLGNSRGGLVGYADGGPLPYGDSDMSDPNKDYFPKEVLQQQTIQKLATPNAPATQQRGLGNDILDTAKTLSSLGSLGSLGSDFMAFLPFLSKGGVVPRQHYDDGGDVPDQTQQPDPIDPTMRAIRHYESGDRYGIVGPADRRGDRPYGAYQVMGRNVGPWTQEALGKALSPDQFLSDQNAQDTVARHRMGQYLQQYGTPQDVASVWFTGKPQGKAGNVQDALGTTPSKYLANFNALYNRYSNGEQDRPSAGAHEAQGVGALQSAQGLGASASAQGASASGSSDDSQSSGGLGGLISSMFGGSGGGDNRMMLSFLSGLGKMAGSNSRYLGSAMLEGLGGGADTYAKLTKQNADIMKETLDIANTRFIPILDGPPGYVRDAFTNEILNPAQKMARLNEMAHRMGVGSLVGGGPASGGLAPAVASPQAPQAPVAPAVKRIAESSATAPIPPAATAIEPDGGQTSATPSTGKPGTIVADAQSAQAPALPASLFKDANPNLNPVYLSQRATELRRQAAQLQRNMGQGLPQPQREAAQTQFNSLQTQADKYMEQAQKVMDGGLTVRDSDGNELPEVNQAIAARKQWYANQEKKNQQITEQTGETYKDARKFGNEFQGNMASINALINSNQKISTNVGSEQAADVAGTLETLRQLTGIDFTTEYQRALQTAVNSGSKNATIEALHEVAAAGMQRAPAVGIRTALATVASPDMAPAAKFNVLMQAKAELQQRKDLYQAWHEAGQPDFNRFMSKWMDAPGHGLDDYWKKFAEETGSFAGMSPSSTSITRFRPGKPNPYLLPESLKNENGEWARSPSTGNWMNKKTKQVFDAYGKPVQ